MFTPPPSPTPRPILIPKDPESLKNPAAPSPCTPTATSPNSVRRTPDKVVAARRLRWTVLLVPLVLIMITASTRYVAHPRALDILSRRPSSWQNLVSEGANWSIHKRHPDPDPQASVSFPGPQTSSGPPIPTTGLPTPTSSTRPSVPTVPSSPPTLPTPFPQPFDSDLTRNFTSVSCFNFFGNMTGSTAFRSCRALSFLSQSSNDFLDAQSNMTLLNDLVWGTCNTQTDVGQCESNMSWFAGALQDACTEDIQANNEVVTTTLTALRAYGLVRTAGCLTNPTSDTYCYLDAAQNSNPADLYFYNLPLGIPLPGSTGKLTLLCSACTQSVMNTYAKALQDSSQRPLLSALSQTYPAAANLADQQCGAIFVATLPNIARSSVKLDVTWWLGLVLVVSFFGFFS